MQGVAVNLSGSTLFRGNGASENSGGGVLVSHGSTVTVQDRVVFIDNQANSGGAIYTAQKTAVEVSGSPSFVNNIGDWEGGGAIYTDGYPLCTVSFRISIFRHSFMSDPISLAPHSAATFVLHTECGCN